MDPSEAASTAISLIKQLGLWGIPIFLVFYFLFFPEKATKASSVLWGILHNVFRVGERRYIRYDIEGRVNDFTKTTLKKEIREFDPPHLKIQWVKEGQNEEDFIRNEELVVRVRKRKNQNINFVNVAMVFISRSVLPKAKRYVSQKQKESIDLYTAKKLFESEKQEVLDQFVSEYLVAKTEDEKIGDYFKKFDNLDRAGLFFSVLIQELTFLGEKVFADRKDQAIVEEVAGLVDFLNDYANRKVGDTSVSDFKGAYCRFAIRIVGDANKIQAQGSVPYIHHIKQLAEEGYETVYLVGADKNKDFMEEIASSAPVYKEYEKYHSRSYRAILRYDEGQEREVPTYLIVLRARKRENYIKD